MRFIGQKNWHIKTTVWLHTFTRIRRYRLLLVSPQVTWWGDVVILKPSNEGFSTACDWLLKNRGQTKQTHSSFQCSGNFCHRCRSLKKLRRKTTLQILSCRKYQQRPDTEMIIQGLAIWLHRLPGFVYERFSFHTFVFSAASLWARNLPCSETTTTTANNAFVTQSHLS